MMGLPIGLFMALIAVLTPFAGHWADRFGSRRTLLLGTLPAVAGFIGTATAGSMTELLMWRGACALGYAVMFIGAQGFVARHTPADRRARGMAQFVAAVISPPHAHRPHTHRSRRLRCPCLTGCSWSLF